MKCPKCGSPQVELSVSMEGTAPISWHGNEFKLDDYTDNVEANWELCEALCYDCEWLLEFDGSKGLPKELR